MTSALNIAITGLSDATQRVANAASNIVNASSIAALPQSASSAYTGFVPQDVISLSASAGGNALGVTTSTEARAPAYTASYDPTASVANSAGLVASPNVDLTSELVSSNTAQISYSADAAVIRTAEKTQKALLDILS